VWDPVDLKDLEFKENVENATRINEENSGRIRDGQMRTVRSLASIPFPYEDSEDEANSAR